ncbi:cyclin-like protein [Entophlyctis helioformis]|nr:cyclin-like protein [Entophlyctis helioformis]
MAAPSSPLYYTHEELQASMAQRGISKQHEVRTRLGNTRLLRKLSQRLGLPHYSCATAHYLYHRFFARYSIMDYDHEEVILACISLGMKIEETVKRLRDVYVMLQSIVHDVDMDPEAKDMGDVRDHVMTCERMLLEDIQFEMAVHHPFRFVLALAKTIGASYEVSEKAWRVVVDSYRSTVCIEFPPQTIAVAALFLAHKFRSVEPPSMLLESEWLEKHYSAILLIIESSVEAASSDEEVVYFGKISIELQQLFQAGKRVSSRSSGTYVIRPARYPAAP